MHEDLFCALFLPTNATAAELVKSLNDYISGRLNWPFCVGVCTDRECESIHCVIHREMLASRKLSPELNGVLQDVVKVINHIKVHFLNLHLFDQQCEEMDAEHKHLLLDTNVRWLSRGRLLTRAFEFRESLQRFLLEKVNTGRVFY